MEHNLIAFLPNDDGLFFATSLLLLLDFQGLWGYVISLLMSVIIIFHHQEAHQVTIRLRVKYI